MTIDIGIEIRNIGDSSLVRYYSVKHACINSNAREIVRSNECTVYSCITLTALVD
jgi:D-ribose pyranose/furanose isomerase RbsD